MPLEQSNCENSFLGDFWGFFKGFGEERVEGYLLIRSMGRACSSKRQECL